MNLYMIIVPTKSPNTFISNEQVSKPKHTSSLYELLAPAAKAAGLLTTNITESPLKNILLTYLSLLMDVPRVLPLPPLEYSVHISLTSSRSLLI